VTITRIDTLRLEEYPNLLYVLVHDDQDRVGVGETFYAAAVVEAWIHGVAAPLIVGRNSAQITATARSLRGYVGWGGSGAETRGRSAIDIALWDLLGQTAGLPLHGLLGGEMREATRVYNTCAGYRYVRARTTQSLDNWGLPSEGGPAGPYEDLDGFLTRPAELAESLLAEGIRAMKIWPFDPYAELTGGTRIDPADLERGLQPLREIRAAVGDEMEVMIELHGLWQREPARRIVAACDPFRPFWYEDPLAPHDVEGLATLSARTPTPIAVGETVAGLSSFRRLCERGAAGVLVFDVGWCGGLTEARSIAALAESHGLPVVAHDCTGPVGFTVGSHLSAALPNAGIQEFVRAHHTTWYRELIDGLPPVENGEVRPPSGPGLGVRLRPEIFERPDAVVRTSSADRATAARG
jgi:L-alanine-DL-glutamate epimerase-like enolase superfamily enzyme